MDEQQIMQILDQIPLEALQQYIAQREQQEQAAAQQQAPQEAMPQQGAYPAEAGMPMARGGRLYSPYVDVYACGGRMKRR